MYIHLAWVIPIRTISLLCFLMAATIGMMKGKWIHIGLFAFFWWKSFGWDFKLRPLGASLKATVWLSLWDWCSAICKFQFSICLYLALQCRNAFNNYFKLPWWIFPIIFLIWCREIGQVYNKYSEIGHNCSSSSSMIHSGSFSWPLLVWYKCLSSTGHTHTANLCRLYPPYGYTRTVRELKKLQHSSMFDVNWFFLQCHWL